MSNKFKIDWIKPPAAYLAKEGLTMIMTDVNVVWHNEDDVEVTQFFQYPLPKSERVKKSLLSQGYDTAKDQSEVIQMRFILNVIKTHLIEINSIENGTLQTFIFIKITIS